MDMKIIQKQRNALKEKIDRQQKEIETSQEFKQYEEKRLNTIEKFHHIVNSPRPDIKFDISENGLTVLQKRYLKKNGDGEIVETPEDRLWSVAVYIAIGRAVTDETETEDSVYQRARKYYEIMASKKFVPNSPTLMNAGKELGQLSACFVLPVEDNTDEIFKAITRTALIHKSGGGTGFSFSRLRPKNDVVSTTHGVASGPVSFMRVFDSATEEIKQGGTRRGANMGILNVEHPDILEFLNCKKDGKTNQNFNISIAVTEDFYQKALQNEEYELINPRTKEIVQKLNAKEVLDMIVSGAWRNGEPGIVFIDRINQDNPTPKIGRIESTNPCGEQPLLPFESCNLGSINLAKFVKDGEFNFEMLKSVTKFAVNFLNDVIDVNFYPIAEIWQMTKGNRKIGLGAMGLADVLVSMEIPYDSEEAVELGGKIMETIQTAGMEESEKMAEQYGEFPNFDSEFFEKPIRNATITTIAPTGTISIIAGASSGIEPYFAIAYIRQKVLDGDPMPEVNPLFVKIAKDKDFYSEELMKKIAEVGSVQEIEEVPEEVKRIFKTALEIPPEWHIRMQAAFQKYTDNAVSKTVNFPQSATPEQIKEAYDLAHKLGCKGVTVYRDKSRDQVLNIGSGSSSKSPIDVLSEEVSKLRVIAYGKDLSNDRGKVTPGFIIKEPTGDYNSFITLGFMCGKEAEVFINVPKPTPREAEFLRDIAITTSRSLQDGVRTAQQIANDKLGVVGEGTSGDEFGSNTSLSDALGKTLVKARFQGMSNFDTELKIKMLETEKLLLQGLIMTREQKKLKQSMIAQVMNGDGIHDIPDANNVEIDNPLQMIAQREPCPNCQSTEYMLVSQGGCDVYTCCWYSKCG